MDEKYLMGSCHHLAVAMHRLTGWDLAVVATVHRGEESVFHVFCVAPDGTAWDARGATSVSSLVDEQEAMDGTEVWPIRLPDEASVWSLAKADKLYPIHETHVLDALGAAEDALDGAATIVSDGWKPRDPEAVRQAAAGGRPIPRLDRDARFEPPAAGPGPR